MKMKQNTNYNQYQLINKKENWFVGKVSLFASFLFAIIFAISFVISKYAFINNVDYNYLILIGSIALIVTLVFSLIMSFKGLKASFGLIITTILLYSLSFIIMFSAYFSLINNTILFFALAFTALSTFIIGIISFIIPSKAAYSILKFSMISFVVYIFVSIVGSLIIWFTTTVNLEIWEIFLTSFLGLIIILSSIMSFYNLRKTTEFINITNIDKTSYNKLMLFQTFNILSSIIMIFIFVLRILGIINRN